ncbi:hypothetical protein CLOM_g4515 [Closterium sp. NIES-68]|nr:hypothetical protein CLOM_g4515 [Closterium sp. NIES-68]
MRRRQEAPNLLRLPCPKQHLAVGRINRSSRSSLMQLFEGSTTIPSCNGYLLASTAEGLVEVCILSHGCTMLAYNPNESQRNTNNEALGQGATLDLSLRNLPLDILNDMRQFVLQYQAFKRLMKSESIGDYTGFTVSTPSKPRGEVRLFSLQGMESLWKGKRVLQEGELEAPFSAPVHGVKRKRGTTPKAVPATPQNGSGDEWMHPHKWAREGGKVTQ